MGLLRRLVMKLVGVDAFLGSVAAGRTLGTFAIALSICVRHRRRGRYKSPRDERLTRVFLWRHALQASWVPMRFRLVRWVPVGRDADGDG